jgi:hypothetical protein
VESPENLLAELPPLIPLESFVRHSIDEGAASWYAANLLGDVCSLGAQPAIAVIIVLMA